MKLIILIAVFICGTIGSWLGAQLDHGNWLGGWSVLLGAIGSFAGVWVGYRAGQMIDL